MIEARGERVKCWNPVFYNDIRPTGSLRQVYCKAAPRRCFARSLASGDARISITDRGSPDRSDCACRPPLSRPDVRMLQSAAGAPVYPAEAATKRGEPAAVQFALEKFRHDIFAEHQIGEDHRRHVEEQTCQPIRRSAQPCRRPPSARRPAPVRASKSPILSAPHAPCGTLRPFHPYPSQRAPKHATRNGRPHGHRQAAARPARPPLSGRIARPHAQLPRRIRRHAPNFAGSTSRQHQNQRWICQTQTLFEVFRTQVRRDVRSGGVRHKSGRPTKLAMTLAQTAEAPARDQRSVRIARARPGTPRPHRGTYVIDDGNFRQLRARTRRATR